MRFGTFSSILFRGICFSLIIHYQTVQPGSHGEDMSQLSGPLVLLSIVIHTKLLFHTWSVPTSYYIAVCHSFFRNEVTYVFARGEWTPLFLVTLNDHNRHWLVICYNNRKIRCGEFYEGGKYSVDIVWSIRTPVTSTLKAVAN
jgi:hypothetical protein